jgi:hypothetical protein
VIACADGKRDKLAVAAKGWRKGVLKVIGQVFVVLGAAVLGIVVWLLLAGHDLAQPLGRVWYTVHSASLNLLQAIVQRYIYADLWDGVFVPFLLLSGWQALAFLTVGFFVIGGLLLFAAGRRRHRSFRR